jgi:hypothetical protein
VEIKKNKNLNKNLKNPVKKINRELSGLAQKLLSLWPWELL